MNNTTLQGYNLSPQQKRLYLSLQNNTHIQTTIAIKGQLQLEILKTALENLINRHEILHTKFQQLPGLHLPLQVIAEPKLSWQVTNINTQLIAQKESTLSASIYVVSSTEHILMLSLPALCTDTIGMQNLVDELATCYTATLNSENIFTEPLQYVDIAQWENELLEAEDRKIAKNYWLQQLSELSETKLLGENQATESVTFQAISFSIKELQVQIANLASKYQTSTTNLLLTAWHILIHRLTQQTKTTVFTAFSGRKYEELKPAIGLLVKYLPINCNFSEDSTFAELIQQIEQTNQLASQWQEYCLEELELARATFGFDFADLSQNYYAGDILFNIKKIAGCVESFKLRLSGVQTENGIDIEFHYNASLFTNETIQELTEQFYTLLNSLVHAPNIAIDRLEILSDRQKHQLIVEFNQTQANYPKDKCFHQLFAEQVSLTPNNIAVVFADQQLTYAQLDDRANKLAHYLQTLGVGAEVLVGICVERSPMMLIGILAILKAGGAYVPLDPTYPQQRLAWMLEDSQLPILLTQKHLATLLPPHQAQVIYLDTDWEIPLSPPYLPCLPSPSNLAYVIYTSGSTGKPKGTLIEHRGLVNYLYWCIQAYAIEQGNGAVVHSSIGFDATITGLFAPLLVGRQVRLLPENLGIEALSNTLQTDAKYSLVKITPAHLDLLRQQISPQQAANWTNALIIGGENLTLAQISFWQEYAPDTLLVNEYGPTETVVGCCTYAVPQGKQILGSVPIGRAIANTQLYILDRYLQPVPLGVAGELYIGGDGVGRGYLNQPKLTAEKFIDNPFTPGTKLYKSGDLARYLPDGNIEYLGRIDAQVKIRGFRIELGEIETLLNEHPSIQTAVVVASDNRLIAYIVQLTAIDEGEIREYLAAQLPEYMLPAVFVVLESFPLTPNGKVDRQALPTPEQIRPQLTTFVAPQNATEEAIAQIWTEVLKIDQIGIHDNFFALGGHSLLLTQVTSRLYQEFTTEVSLRQLFDTPTIAQLAEVITQKLLAQTDDATLAQMLAELE